MKFLDLQKVNAVYATDLKRIAAEVSENYDEADYIRDYEEFLKIRDF